MLLHHTDYTQHQKPEEEEEKRSERGKGLKSQMEAGCGEEKKDRREVREREKEGERSRCCVLEGEMKV